MTTIEHDLAPLVALDDKPVTFWCRGCQQAVVMVIDPSSGCIDWGAPFGDDIDGLDFGCEFGADLEGSPGHMPARDVPAVRRYWTRHQVKR